MGIIDKNLMTMELTSNTFECQATVMVLTGRNEIPDGLKKYTDGYAADVTMTIGDEGALAGDMARTCWSVAPDKKGHFCFGYTAGEFDYNLEKSALKYIN